nr:MAG TPA: Splicing factor 3B subunit 4 complex, splicing, RNA, protein [Bacteriophage sp.]
MHNANKMLTFCIMQIIIKAKPVLCKICITLHNTVYPI